MIAVGTTAFLIHPLEQIVNVHWTGGDFIIPGSNITNAAIVRYSADGKTWLQISTPGNAPTPVTSSGGGIAYVPSGFRAMASGNGMWLGVDWQGTIWKSEDRMQTWTLVNATDTCDQIVFGNVKNPDDETIVGLFVALNTNLIDFPGGPTPSTNVIYTSSNGTDWTTETAPWNGLGTDGNAFSTSLSFANGIFFIGVSAVTPDTTSWYYTSKTGKGDWLGNVAFAGLKDMDPTISLGADPAHTPFLTTGTSVLECDPGNVVYSPDLNIYVACASYSVGGGGFGSGLVATIKSPDGLSWSQARQYGTFTQDFRANSVTHICYDAQLGPVNMSYTSCSIARGTFKTSDDEVKNLFLVPCRARTYTPNPGLQDAVTYTYTDINGFTWSLGYPIETFEKDTYFQNDFGVLRSMDGDSFTFTKITPAVLVDDGTTNSRTEYGPSPDGLSQVIARITNWISHPEPLPIGQYIQRIAYSSKLKKFLAHIVDMPDVKYIINADPPEQNVFITGTPQNSFWLSSDNAETWAQVAKYDAKFYSQVDPTNPFTDYLNASLFITTGPLPKPVEEP